MFNTTTIKNSDITYLVDDNNRVSTIGGGKKALIQYIYMQLRTERFKFPIFSNNYGLQTEDLIGANTDLIKALLPKRIIQTLDNERIIKIDNFVFDNSMNEEKAMYVSFDVNSVYGLIQINGVKI